MKKKHTGPNRRVGLSDRRKKQSNPVQRPAKGGWGAVGPTGVYKRTDAFGKVTFSKDQRIGPTDRRKKK